MIFVCAGGLHTQAQAGRLTEAVCLRRYSCAASRTMPLTHERIKEIQEECLADDVDVPPEAAAWTEDEAFAYFESGGRALPQLGAGFRSAEIHAFYELKQRRFESLPADTMVDALSAALFKTTGEAKFKPQEDEQKDQPPAEPDYGNMTREAFQEPKQKYAVPKIGDVGSSSHNDDDTFC